MKTYYKKNWLKEHFMSTQYRLIAKAYSEYLLSQFNTKTV